MRKEFPALANPDMSCIEARPFEDEKALVLHRWKGHRWKGHRWKGHRWKGSDEIVALFNFGKDEARVPISGPQSGWLKMVNSLDQCWAGPGSALPEYLSCGPDHLILIEPLSVALHGSSTRGNT
jgi:hypothetical protein